MRAYWGAGCGAPAISRPGSSLAPGAFSFINFKAHLLMRLAQPVSPLRTPQASGQVPPPSPPRRSSSLSPGQAPKPSRAKKTPV